MSESPNFRSIQKRTLQIINYEDGLWDLLLGITFMLLAIYPVTRAVLGPAWNLGMFIALMLVAIVILQIIRGQISTPRIGYVKPKRSAMHKVIIVILTMLVAATFSAVIITLNNTAWIEKLIPAAQPAWLQRYFIDILVLLVIGSLFSIMGYAFGVSRLYLYGWLIGAGNLASVIMNQGAPERFNFPLGIAAGIIILTGAVILFRFLRDYPVRSQEA